MDICTSKDVDKIKPDCEGEANLYSLIETAKANHCEPYQYLSWMLNQLPSTPSDSIEKLMPWNMPEAVNRE